MSLGRLSCTNSRMNVLSPEPEGPTMRKICRSSPVAAPTRTSRRTHRPRALESEARTKLYAIGQFPLPAEVPVIEMPY
jgi:hypothetical protein